jgi:hypothetical protein
MALRKIFSEFFGFPCQSSFHQTLYTHHLSSGAGTIGQLVTDVPSRLSLIPTQEGSKQSRCFVLISCLAYSSAQNMEATNAGWLSPDYMTFDPSLYTVDNQIHPVVSLFIDWKIQNRITSIDIPASYLHIQSWSKLRRPELDAECSQRQGARNRKAVVVWRRAYIGRLWWFGVGHTNAHLQYEPWYVIRCVKKVKLSL